MPSIFPHKSPFLHSSFAPNNAPSRNGPPRESVLTSAARHRPLVTSEDPQQPSATSQIHSPKTIAANRVKLQRRKAFRPVVTSAGRYHARVVTSARKRGLLLMSARAGGSSGTPRWRDGPRGVVFSAEELAEATGGVLVIKGREGSICTDTRKLDPGDWFLALRGNNFDGHEFLEQAATANCCGVVAEIVPKNWSLGFIKVPNTLKALQSAAAYIRAKFHGPVVAITGSTGKTTTRAMVGLALEALGPIHQTSGNFNNHIGVPLTLLSMPHNSKAAVLELGMSRPGEISELVGICCPNVRLITNVGPVHVEECGSEAGVAKAKAELFDTAEENNICILNSDDRWVRQMALKSNVSIVKYGRGKENVVRLVFANSINNGLGVEFFIEHQKQDGVIETAKCEIPHPGLHLAQNALAASAVAVSLGIPLQVATAKVAKYSPVGARLKIEKLEKMNAILLNDVYNANPMSVKAAIEMLRAAGGGGRKVVVLGDMLELGDLTEEAHAAILRLCFQNEFAVVAVCGTAFKNVAMGPMVDRLEHIELIVTDDALGLAEILPEKVKNGDLILVKGSRSMRMERVCEALHKVHNA